MTKVLRKCDKCGIIKGSDDFTYLGDGVFACLCGSKYTHICEVIELDDKE